MPIEAFPATSHLVGRPAPSFALPTPDGEYVSLNDYRGRKLILVFLRHFAWLPCREHLSQLRRRYREIQSSGGEVLAISFEDEGRVSQLARQMQLPFTLLSDPQRDTYRDYGLFRGTWRQVFGLKTIWAYIRLLLRGRRYHFRDSDLRQLGGDFVIDAQGVVRFGHPSSQPHDRPEVEQLLEVVKEI